MEVVRKLNKRLIEEVLEKEEFEADLCTELLKSLDEELISGKNSAVKKMNLHQILEATKVGKTLTKSVKAFRRVSRQSEDPKFKMLVQRCNSLLSEVKVKVHEEARGSKKASPNEEISDESVFPSSTSQYRHRLVSQKKEIYKDPPVSLTFFEQSFVPISQSQDLTSQISLALAGASKS